MVVVAEGLRVVALLPCSGWRGQGDMKQLCFLHHVCAPHTKSFPPSAFLPRPPPLSHFENARRRQHRRIFERKNRPGHRAEPAAAPTQADELNGDGSVERRAGRRPGTEGARGGCGGPKAGPGRAGVQHRLGYRQKVPVERAGTCGDKQVQALGLRKTGRFRRAAQELSRIRGCSWQPNMRMYPLSTCQTPTDQRIFFSPQVREHLTATDLSGWTILAHSLRSGHCQLFEAALRAVREDVLDAEVFPEDHEILGVAPAGRGCLEQAYTLRAMRARGFPASQVAPPVVGDLSTRLVRDQMCEKFVLICVRLSPALPQHGPSFSKDVAKR